MTTSWESRFWPKVVKLGNGCWIWTAATDDRHHPQFKEGICWKATRFLWIKLKGPLTQSDYVHHRCGIPLCVNLDHLFVAGKRNINKRPVLERFFEKVRKTNGCWLWVGRITPFGYGAFFFEGRDQPAHRVSWILHNGPITNSEIDVCHKCDVPDCVRPDHLFLGSAADNILDCHQKGRAVHPVGEAAGKAKLKEFQVLAIRAMYDFDRPQPTRLGRIFGVTAQTIHAIAHRRIWRHI